MRIFLDDTDYRKFLAVLGDVVGRFDLECCDYCLMPNHYHLAISPRHPNLSPAIQHLNGVYATWWNVRHATVGHVFQGRFKDQIVQREGYLLALSRYIARNPVRAGLVERPEAWPWSAYQSIAGLSVNPGFLAREPVLRQFGDVDDDERRARYVRHVLDGLDDDALVDRLRSKESVVGDQAFRTDLLESRRTQEVGGVRRRGAEASPAAPAP
jgi:putative transposase